MIITYRSLSKVCFPIYPLPSDDWYLQDGLVFVDGIIVDDRNMPGQLLGQRRMQSPFKTMMPLRKAINSYIGVIKNNFPLYIDSKGRLFKYEKSKFCLLKYYKISRIERKRIASILWLHGVNVPFDIPRPPEDKYSWAGVLHIDGDPWVLYDYAEERKPDTRRKI